MAYNVVSSAARWIKNKMAGRPASCMTDGLDPSWYKIIDRQTECGEWNGLEPFDFLRGWNGSGKNSDETS